MFYDTDIYDSDINNYGIEYIQKKMDERKEEIEKNSRRISNEFQALMLEQKKLAHEKIKFKQLTQKIRAIQEFDASKINLSEIPDKCTMVLYNYYPESSEPEPEPELKGNDQLLMQHLSEKYSITVKNIKVMCEYGNYHGEDINMNDFNEIELDELALFQDDSIISKMERFYETFDVIPKHKIKKLTSIEHPNERRYYEERLVKKYSEILSKTMKTEQTDKSAIFQYGKNIVHGDITKILIDCDSLDWNRDGYLLEGTGMATALLLEKKMNSVFT